MTERNEWAIREQKDEIRGREETLEMLRREYARGERTLSARLQNWRRAKIAKAEAAVDDARQELWEMCHDPDTGFSNREMSGGEEDMHVYDRGPARR